MRTSRLLGIRTPIAVSAGLIAALVSPLAARGDNWTTSNSGSISSLPTTRVGIGATPASNVHLDVTSNTSARIGLRVNQVQTNASVAEFRQNGTNKVVITSTGLLQTTAGVTGTVSNGTAVSGSSTNGTGISGTSTFQSGVTGTASQGGSGVSGTSLNGSGVQGSSTGDGIGVTGTGSGSVSVPFLSTTATGVFGSSSRGYGVYGRTTAGDGAAPLAGVLGQSATLNSFAPGVMGVYQGQDNQVPGVQGLALGPGGFTDFSSPGTGVQGVSGATGVEGISMGGMGVVGKASRCHRAGARASPPEHGHESQA